MVRKRTKRGSVTAAARKRYGMKGGRFPIFDAKSARSAIRLRGHAKSKKERSNIIRRAAKFAPGMAKKARQRDKKR